MKHKQLLMVAIFVTATAGNALAGSVAVNFNFYVDDYATVDIDGSLVGSYDNPAAAGNIIFTPTLAPGWHTFAITYENQAGTNFLDLRQEYPSDSGFSVIPLDDFRSLNQSSQFISGLQANYYTLGGSYLFTIYGEGPIDNGALSFTSEIYEGQPGLWAGAFGPSAEFEEQLSGELLVSATPEPSSWILTAVGTLLLLGFKLKAGKGWLSRAEWVRTSRHWISAHSECNLS